MKPLYEEHNRPIRSGLRALGFVLLPVGGIFVLIGLVDFFSAMGRFGGPPTKFWCLFVGMPLVAAGSWCLKAGFLRTIGTYVAGESVPIVTESARYAARELKPEVRELARAGREDGASAVERMKQLEELKRSGLISDAEYAEKRAEILGKL